MKQYILLITTIFVSPILFTAHAQDIDFHLIKSIDPGELELSDFNFLKNEIGDAQIVFLGEQDHGDGATMLAKTCLIKYLVNQMGFSVVAFEGDFLSLNDSTLSVENRWEKLPGIWKDSDQMITLKNILISADVKIAGIDLFGTYGIDKFQSIYWSSVSKLTDLKEEEINSTVHSVFHGSKSKKQVLKEVYRINRLVIEQSNGFEKQLFEAFQHIIDSYQQLPKKDRIGFEKYQERDTQMAINLDWLMNNTLKGEKIIVWAANYHVANNPNQIESDKNWRFRSGNLVSMGYKFDQLSEIKSYRIAVSSYSGQYTDWTHSLNEYVDIKPERHFENSLEFLLSKKDVKYAYVPLKDIESEFSLSGFTHKAYRGKWKEVFDAVLYIENMTPSTFEQSQKNQKPSQK